MSAAFTSYEPNQLTQFGWVASQPLVSQTAPVAAQSMQCMQSKQCMLCMLSSTHYLLHEPRLHSEPLRAILPDERPPSRLRPLAVSLRCASLRAVYLRSRNGVTNGSDQSPMSVSVAGEKWRRLGRE